MYKILLLCTLFFVKCSLFSMEHVPGVFKDLPEGAQQYLEDLPRAKLPENANDPVEQSKAITDYLLFFGGYDQDAKDRDVIQNKILTSIRKEEPIRRIIPAFPTSSSSPNKIPFDDQHSFGFGELVALLTQNHISKEIGRVHKPGSTLAIYWEPFMREVNQEGVKLFDVPVWTENRINSYQATLRDITKYLEPQVTIGKLPHGTLDAAYNNPKYTNMKVPVVVRDLEHYKAFMEEEINSPRIDAAIEQVVFDQEKLKLLKDFDGKSLDDIKADPKLYAKLKRKKLPVKKYRKDAALKLAEAIFVGSKKNAAMLKEEVPDYKDQIRMSVRADHGVGVKDKIGTPMIYGSQGTPWHKVLVVKSKKVTLEHYKDLLKSKINAQKKSYTVDDHEMFYFTEKEKGEQKE